MSYPTPRRVELHVTDTDLLTILEFGRALAAADVREREAVPLLRLMFRRDGEADPAEYARGILLAYAIVWQLERRADPSLSWDQAQTWDVQPVKATPDEEEAARIGRGADEYVAKAALATGLPPAVAAELTLSQMGALGDARQAASRRQRRARVHR